MSTLTHVLFKTAATDHHALSEIFARNLHLDELSPTTRSEEEFLVMEKADHHPPSSIVQTTAVKLSPHTGENDRGCCYQRNNIQLQGEANTDDALGLSAVERNPIQHVLPINPRAILLRAKARPRKIRASSLLPRHSAIHKKRHSHYHRRYLNSATLLRCQYAPWAQAISNSSRLCVLLQHLNPPPHPHPPRFTNNMSTFGLGKKRRRADWLSMNDDMVSEAGGLDTMFEEEFDKSGD